MNSASSCFQGASISVSSAGRVVHHRAAPSPIIAATCSRAPHCPRDHIRFVAWPGLHAMATALATSSSGAFAP
jgi:hypothetical protein